MTIKLHYFPIVADAGETKTATFRVKLKEKKAVEATLYSST